MKRKYNIIASIIFLLIASSCSNDFLNENLETVILPAGASAIYISPEWEAQDYQFSLPDMGNAGFEIESAPSWMQIHSTTGTLANSIATIHCSATKRSDFSKIGIYLDKMRVSANGKTFYVPVAYITEGNPNIQIGKSLTINYDHTYLQIQNGGGGVLIWSVVSLPDWLSIDMNGISNDNPAGIVPQYASEQLSLNLNLDANFNEELKGVIVLKTNDKNNPTIEVSVVVDLGNPEISLWLNDNKIDFGATSTTYSLDLRAWERGLLVWHFEELPDWLTIAPSKGVYHTHTSYEDLKLTCDRTKLQPGVNSSVIFLKSNAYNKPSIAITVIARAPGDNANIRLLEGNIIDATFDKSANILYYITSQPNKLVAYDVTQRAISHELQLSKVPTCLAVSEDGVKAAVGYGGQISAINLVNWSITNTDVNSTLSDIAWSEGDWFCYTSNVSNGDQLSWINVSNSTFYRSPDSQLYGRDIIKKVPTQPYVIATRQLISPSGFIAYSTSTKNLRSYSHMSLMNFWFSQDGQYTFSANGNVYRTTSSTSSNNTFSTSINSIGQLQGIPTSYFSIKFIDHSSPAHKVWAIENIENPIIYQFDDNDFAFQKSYAYSDVYKPDTQSAAYEVQAQYIFSDKEGAGLSVLRKGKNNNNWSIEFIQVTQ